VTITVPRPSDYATSAAFHTAYDTYRRQVDAAAQTDMLAQLAAAGARTTDCPCGYSPFDTCPIHD
jgi:hypothetical protein